MRLIDADELEVNKGTIDDWYTHEFVYKDDIDDAPTIEIPKWVPVSERLPDMGKYVLCSVDKDHVYESDLEVVITQFRNEGWWTDGRIKAWMPLPEPYKEGVEK